MSLTYTILLLVVINIVLSIFLKRSNTLYCGIIGFSAPAKTKFNLNSLKVLFYINSLLRGKDSVGFYTPLNGLKKVGEDYSIMIEKEDNIIDTLIPDNELIGHVRASTIGAKTEKNAHPWEFDNIIGLHNGTLRDFIAQDYSIGKKYGFNYLDYDVDSQVLLKALDKNFETLEENLLPALEEYEGAAALLMYHKERGTIFACHDTERPLFYGYVGKAMYISSLKHTLQIIGCNKVEAFEENYVHEIKEGQIINKFAYKPQSRIVKPKYQPVGTQLSFEDFIDKGICVTNGQWEAYLQYDEETTNAIGKAMYPATGIGFNGFHTFINYNAKLFQHYNFRLRSNQSKVETKDSLTDKMIKFYPDKDFFKVIEADPTTFNGEATVFNIRTKKKYRIKSHLLDISRVVPSAGMFVKAVTDICYVDSRKYFCAQHEVLEVSHFEPRTGAYSCKTLTGLTASLLPEHFVLADSVEVIGEAFQVGRMDIYNKILNQQPEAEEAEVVDNIEDHSCSIVLKDPTEILIETDDSIFESETAMVDCEKLDAFILNIKESVENIDDMLEGNSTKDAQEEAKQLRGYIGNYDFKQIIL